MRNRLVDGALLELRNEFGRDWIFQRAHLLYQPQNRLVRWGLCADQDQAANTARLTQHHSLCKEGPRRSPDEGSFFDADRVHERIYIGGEVFGRVAAFGLI